MRRAVAAAASALLVFVIGCSHGYEQRLEATLRRMEYLQKLDQFLTPPVAGTLQESAVFLRPPKPMAQATEPYLTVEAGRFDINATFLEQASAAAQPADKSAPPPASLKLHVLGRVNRKNPPAKKKGEEQPPPQAPRGNFVEDVRNLLASDIGGQEALSNSLQNDKKRSNDFKRLIFTAANGDAIRVYFYKSGDHDLALVWDIPPGQEKSPVVGSGADYMMEALAVGPRAVTSFQGGDADEGLVESGEAASPLQPGAGF